jgi:hypothetical protein
MENDHYEIALLDKVRAERITRDHVETTDPPF